MGSSPHQIKVIIELVFDAFLLGMARNQDNVSEWSDMSTLGLL